MTELILKHRQLTVKDLEDIMILERIENDNFIITRSQKGYKLKGAVTIKIENVLEVGQKGLIEYIIKSFLAERPRLIPFVFENNSLVELARYFLRYCSGSPLTLYSYVDSVSRYSSWIGFSPDEIIRDAKAETHKHIKFLEDYIAILQDEGLSPGRVHGYAKHIKTFYRVKGVEVKLPHPLSRRVIYKDRAPKPEELVRLLEIADLREKILVSLFALGGFREGTVNRLQYRHVRDDLEKGVMPLHIHIESEITKGKYADYDTFLGQEAVEYLHLYLEQRRHGSIDGKIPPEIISDMSPLIRDLRAREPKHIGSKQIRKIIHNLYLRAGLIKPSNGRMYELRVHSLRKYFKTQLEALGVKSDYIEYMMGHKINTYHDVQSMGVEFLRNIYTSSGLSIKPKTHVSKIDALKEIIRAWGMDPEKILVKDAIAEPHRIYVTSQEREEEHITILGKALRDLVKKEAHNQ